MKYKVKLIVGFRRDQEHTIPANEAHKAYYLFTHPDERGIFSNGLAIKGDQIQEIVPDYNATMGWNPTYVLTNDDHNELQLSGIKEKLQWIMSEAKEVGTYGDPSTLSTPLNVLLKGNAPTQKIYGGSRSMKQLLESKAQTQ